MSRTIQLQPFATLVEGFKTFHANKEFSSPAMDDREVFNKDLSEVTTSLSPANIRNFLRVAKTPYLEGVNRQEHIQYVRDLRAQIVSHLCLADEPDGFRQSQAIVVDTMPCNYRDVIFWADEWMIVESIDTRRNTASTITFKGDEEFYDRFEFGLEGEPHYILGTYVV